jgi:alcohol dehydrogenase class IV
MQCQIAAWMSLFSDAGVRTGLSHALGHQIGARCGVPHGVTSCITLPHVMRFIAPAAAHRLAALATAMDIAHGDDESADAAAAAEAVAALVTRLGLTARLRDAGVPQSELPAIAQAAWEEAGTHQGPRPAASLDELTGLLQSMW